MGMEGDMSLNVGCIMTLDGAACMLDFHQKKNDQNTS